MHIKDEAIIAYVVDNKKHPYSKRANPTTDWKQRFLNYSLLRYAGGWG